MNVYIYALCDPESGAIQYIGQTKNIKKRLTTHLQCNDANERKNRWIASLLVRWQEPDIVVLSECDEKDADNKETEWIVRLRASGVGLLNTETIRRTTSFSSFRVIDGEWRDEDPDAYMARNWLVLGLEGKKVPNLEYALRQTIKCDGGE